MDTQSLLLKNPRLSVHITLRASFTSGLEWQSCLYELVCFAGHMGYCALRYRYVCMSHVYDTCTCDGGVKESSAQVKGPVYAYIRMCIHNTCACDGECGRILLRIKG